MFKCFFYEFVSQYTFAVILIVRKLNQTFSAVYTSLDFVVQ